MTPFAHSLDDGQSEYEDSMHRSLRAAMERAEHSAPLADAPDDVEALGEVLNLSPLRCTCGRDQHAFCGRCIARYVMRSDWLAARDADLTARAEARGAAAVLAAVGAAMATPADTPFRAKCAMVAAARAAAASYTRDGADGEADHG